MNTTDTTDPKRDHASWMKEVNDFCMPTFEDYLEEITEEGVARFKDRFGEGHLEELKSRFEDGNREAEIDYFELLLCYPHVGDAENIVVDESAFKVMHAWNSLDKQAKESILSIVEG